MPKPYDAVTKYLIDFRPADWLALLGVPASDIEPFEVELYDTDLSTVTSQADRVLKINGLLPRLQHIELETGHHGAESAEKLLRFSVLASGKYKLPVDSALILLRREADSPALTGQLHHLRRDGEAYLSFEYTVVRLWELPLENLLTGGLGTLPLAPLANVTAEQIPDVVRQMQERLEAESPTDAEEGEFWTATGILLGLRYADAFVLELLKGVRRMKESTFYQAIVREGEAKGRAEGLAEGRAQEARRMLLLACEGRLGEPSAAAAETLATITSPERLEYLMRHVFRVETWDELLSRS